MPILLSTLMLFSAFLAIHFVIWKVRLPKRHTPVLLIICIAVFLSWLAFSLVCYTEFLTLLHVALYYCSLSLCYIITYSAIEGDSPTLSLVRFVEDKGPGGCSPEEIARFMEERPFIGARVAALLNSGLIRKENDRYVITGSEPFAFRLVFAFRRLYGSIPKGG